jgi:glycosyltransferase involved in cell wall biosynthesis
LKYFIIIPELILTGPTKGAVALSNGLISQNRNVFLIVLKKNKNVPTELMINRLVSIHYLEGNVIQKIFFFKGLVSKIKPNFKISFGFSADVLNYFIKSNFSSSISSVRGNLFINYYMDFGFLGKILAFIHYRLISKFTIVLSMTNSMKSELKINYGINSFLIGNFLDELTVANYQIKYKSQEIIYFTFIGSLSLRKNVIYLIENFIEFSNKRNDVRLIIAGDGPLREKVSLMVENSQKKIHYLGFVNSPYELLAKSHVFVLLSHSEGMSRAALEALFLGNIGLLSKVEGNSELIDEGVNGFLIDINSDRIEEYFEKAYDFVKFCKKPVENYLPNEFNQKIQIKKLIRILENHGKNN